MSPAAKQGSLLNRSPRSRKSLAVGGAGPALPTARRKRAHSIVPGENLKTAAARRRSLLRPTKGILKPSNQADLLQDTTQDVSQAYQNISPIVSPDNTDITANISSATVAEFHTNVHDNTSRKSFGGRRVSFAAHAHVRVFDNADQNTNGSSSPASSPASSSSASAPSDSEDAPPSPHVTGAMSNQPATPSQIDSAQGPRSPSRHSSIASRRHSDVPAYQDDEEEGEESMDLSADAIPPPTNLPPYLLHTESAESGSIQDNNIVHNSDEEQDSEEDGDMSMTGDFGHGIVSRRRTMSMAGRERRKSRMRSSITAPPSEAGVEAKEFTVSVDRPPPPEDDVFKALKAIANGNRPKDDDGVGSEDGEADMDVTTAVTRLLAVRNSMDGQLPVNDRVEDSFTSTEDSFDGVDPGDRTMNVTNLMGSFRTSDDAMDDERDVTMSAASIISAPISTYPASAPKPRSTPSTTTPATLKPAPFVPASSSVIPIPAFNKSSVPAAQHSSNASHGPSPARPGISRIPSPVKKPIKQFTAAFAPPYQPLKRPLTSSAQDGPNTTVASPSKRRAISADDSSSQRIPVPVVPTETTTSQLPSGTRLPTKARRPSGYFRKSFAGPSAQAEAPANINLFASTSGQQSTARPSTPKKLSSVPTEKPSAFIPTAPFTNVQQNEEVSRVREVSKQSLALPTPTRGSPSPTSPAAKRRLGTETHPPTLISPVDAEGDGVVVESIDISETTPSLSPAQAPNIDPGQWASNVRGDDIPQEDDLAPISVEQFFTMTGIRFMDDMTCPRLSTIHPSQLQQRESNDGEDGTYPLSDYAIAMMVDVAQLETMSWIVNDIQSAIDKYKAQIQETDEDAAKDIPFLFREYATASEEDREQILYVLKLIKAHTILSAKGSWYEWKRGWVQGLLTNAERALYNLNADERQLADIATRAEQTLPSLRTEYGDIMRELKQKQATVAAIENCDQTFLSELKATIAEQRQELDVYRTDIADCNAKLARLKETLEDLEDQARDAKTAIMTAQRYMDMQKASMGAEVFRRRDELNNLQHLHLWQAVQLSAEMVEFVYDSKYRVTMPCHQFSPIPEALDVVPVGDQSHASDDFPLVTELMYRIARRRAIQSHDNKLTLRTIVQRLTDFWASYAQLRWQLNFIIIKYPLSFQLLPAGSGVDDAEGFKATATLLLFKKTSKALISFHFDTELLNYWPSSMELLKFDVSIVYGKADPKVVGDALKTRLSEASVAENHACLVDACMEVVSRYS